MSAGSTAVSQPLAGVRVLVTRAAEQAGSLADLLRGRGAEPIEFPVIHIAPPDDSGPLDAALVAARGYDWLVFTSVNGVESALARLVALGRGPEALAGPLIAAIGPATAGRLRAVGLEPALVPERFVAEEVLAGMLARGVAGRRVLLARAERARDVLPEGLRAAGADVEVVVAYRTLPGRPDPEALARVRSGEVDVVTLTSSSTARNLAALLADDLPAIARARVVCIGPVTADTAREIGLRVDAVAGDYSVPGVVDAIVDLVRTHENTQRSRP